MFTSLYDVERAPILRVTRPPSGQGPFLDLKGKKVLAMSCILVLN